MKFLQNFRCRLRELAYGNPFYRMLLERERAPESLLLTLTDSWPGNAEIGKTLIGKEDGLFENEKPENLTRGRYVLAHNWLRDLRAVGTEAARRKALSLVKEWLVRHDFWKDDSWAPDIIGERLTNWICFYDFFSAPATSDFSDCLISSMMRQWRHLMRIMPCNLTGAENLSAIKGILAAGFALSKSEVALGFGIELLRRQLFAEILSDGGHVSRNPSMQLKVLRYLIDLRTILQSAGQEVPHELTTAIERMVPALKLFRHGDGGLALFNGSFEETPLEIDALLTLSGARGRVLRRLPQTGYERLTLGRSLLLVDVGTPPLQPYDKKAHAGLLSFEFSIGRERLIVNCGSGPDNDPEWRTALAATAAHSTLALNDTNACEVLPEGGIGHRPKPISAQRYEQNEAHYVEAAHNGYENKFHLKHHRALCLAAGGEELHGREVLSGPPGHSFSVRWHLHPSVQASLSQGGQTALLRLPSGSGWRLRIEGQEACGLCLEPSVYGGESTPRRTLQLRFSGHTKNDPTIISWLLAREKKGS